jgi:hypothetical protein
MERAHRTAVGYTGVGAPAPAGAKSLAGAPSSGGGFKPVSLEFATDFQIRFPTSPLAKTMMDAAKAGMDRFMAGPNGSIFDKTANGGRGDYVDIDIPGQKQEKFGTPFGSFEMTPNEYSRFNKAMNKDLGKEWIDAFRKGSTSKIDNIVMGGGAPSTVSEKKEGAPPAVSEKKDGVPSTAIEGGRKTASEAEAQAAADKALAVKKAESVAERTNAALDAAKSARAAEPTYVRAQEILKTPGIEKVMGLVNKGDVLSSITNLVTDSLRVGNYTIGIPAIKRIVTDAGVPQDVLNKALELAQLEAIWQMEIRKGLGAGTSVSNMEQMMANRTTPSQDDPIGAYKQKLAFLQEKSKFQIELAKELKRTKMDIDDFEETSKFDEIFYAYKNSLRNIVSPSSKDTTTKTTKTKPAGKISAEDLKKELGN